jgi:hypothetical protein
MPKLRNTKFETALLPYSALEVRRNRKPGLIKNLTTTDKPRPQSDLIFVGFSSVAFPTKSLKIFLD